MRRPRGPGGNPMVIWVVLIGIGCAVYQAVLEVLELLFRLLITLAGLYIGGLILVWLVQMLVRCLRKPPPTFISPSQPSLPSISTSDRHKQP